MGDEDIFQSLPMPTIGNCFRRMRELRGLTMGDVARSLAVSVVQVSNWELDRDKMDDNQQRQYVDAIFARKGEDGSAELALGLLFNADLSIKVARELDRQAERIDELLERNTELVSELRNVDWQRGVREFHTVVVEHQLPEYPAVPPEPILRRQARLITEEYLETMEAIYGADAAVPGHASLELARASLRTIVDDAPLMVNFTELLDASFDLTYVTIGMFCWCGVDAQGFWSVGQASNMAKAGGPRRASDGKMLKPPGWKPPDFVGEIERQKAAALARQRGPK